ncbi:hypothetical protein EYF80_033670 [Liparis tanakae]|uniref:Uncharacterized protein n=1 Tax=Liparis tanakae TaxID=230148 RepID=A0A4Z2GS99_9TELE|nr:hypothetical protein EYF80_033670 [Liparis tanakae]
MIYSGCKRRSKDQEKKTPDAGSLLPQSVGNGVAGGRTVESRLSLRLSRRFSPTELDLGLTLAELPHGPAGLDAPPAATVDPAQAAPSMLVLFSTFTLTVCRLRADGGGRSPKSCENTQSFSEKPEQLVVLWLFGGGLGRRCAQSRTAGRRLPLDLIAFVSSLLSGGARCIVGVLQQPVQDLMPLRERTVRGGALRAGGGFRRMRCGGAVDSVVAVSFNSSTVAFQELIESGVTQL